MRIDLWATSSHEYENLLRWFVESASNFWPFARWNSQMYMVMQRGSEGDRVWCNSTRGVRCLMAEPPGPYVPDVKGVSYFFSRGLTQANWNCFRADLFVSRTVDWIALVQPDVVFFSDFIPDLLFDWSQHRPRPIIYGAVVPHFVPSVILLGLPWVGEFMDAFPMLVRPAHLRAMREYIVRQTGATTFSQAYQLLIQQHEQFAIARGWTHTANTLVNFESILGSFLYAFYRDEFFWSIRDGSALGLPPEHTCPSLRAAAHFGGGRCKYTGTKRLAARSQALDYSFAAVQLMRGGSSNFAYPPQSDSEQAVMRSLLHGDTGTWSPNVSDAHCGPRRVEALLQTYAQWTRTQQADGQG